MATENQTYQPENVSGDWINPTIIAQIASRIFNDAPAAGSAPRNERDVAHAPDIISSSFDKGLAFNTQQIPPVSQFGVTDILPQDAHKLQPQGNYVPPISSGEGLLQPQWDQQAFLANGADSQQNENNDYYFLSGIKEEKEKPLTGAANNLASQHNYTENKDGSYGLQRFAQRSNSDNTIIPQGFSDNGSGSFEPFFKTFSSGLPLDDKIDFTFLYANVNTHLKQENEDPYSNPGKLLSDASLGSEAINPAKDVSPQWQGKQQNIPDQKCFGQKLYNEASSGNSELNIESFIQSLSQLSNPTQTGFASKPDGFSIPQDTFLAGFPQDLAAKINLDQTNTSPTELQQLLAPKQVPYTSYFLKEEKPLYAKPDIFDVASIRKDFPVLHQNIHGKPLVWFDNAATTQKPWSVINAISEFYARDNSNIHRAAHTLAARSTDAYEGAREKVRKFIGASSTSEIIFVRGTTEGINLVAQTWGRKFIQPGDEIIVSLIEHHANIVPWQMLAKEKGAVIRVAPVNDRGEILMDEYSRLLNPRTKFISLTQTSNGLGTVLPVKEMIQLARRFDVKVLVDGAQSVAHMPTNVQDLDTDFFVFSGHKIYSPTGIGVVYGKKEVLESMPPWQGGGNMIRDVRFEETIYNDIPNKFEAGTPNVADTVGLGAALDYVNKIGIENISRYEHFLTDYGMQQLATVPGLRLIGTARNKVSVLSFVLNGIPNEEVGKYLDQQGIAVRAGHHCTQPALRRFGVESTVRPSLAFYNTTEEIDKLVDAVRKISHK